ncbi:hypothetical protein PR048_012425 [Dryococelus australis]|uniref:Uncharacterized protein n=1 Tax=Dryococelus australis TaxID=614101 RepID=A0ABQ9HPE3_9NEOP|nr:hypothetical protein PR048_012425 [Dryococelus australis]
MQMLQKNFKDTIIFYYKFDQTFGFSLNISMRKCVGNKIIKTICCISNCLRHEFKSHALVRKSKIIDYHK